MRPARVSWNDSISGRGRPAGFAPVIYRFGGLEDAKAMPTEPAAARQRSFS